MPEAKPTVLDYEAPRKTQEEDTTRLIFLLLAIPSLIVLFTSLSHSWAISPWDAVWNLIPGNSRLIKIGPGILILRNINTYTGSTTVSSGVLNLGLAGNPAVYGPISMGGNLNLLMMPFILAIPLLLLKARKQFFGNPTLIEHGLACGFAVCSLGINGRWIWLEINFFASHLKELDAESCLLTGVLVSGILLGMGLMIWLAHTKSGRRIVSEAALLLAYVSMAIFWLIICASLRSIGWYLVCFVVVVFVADLIHLIVQARRTGVSNE